MPEKIIKFNSKQDWLDYVKEQKKLNPNWCAFDVSKSKK